MKKLTTIFLVITLFFAPVILFCEETEKEKAPDFMLKTKEGVEITLSKIKNKVILLNFFAEKCGGCKDEVPYLNKFNENYKGYLQIFAVPFKENNKQRIEKVVKNFGINYPVLIDEKGLVAKGYKVSVLPFSVLISANKYIIKTYTGISEIDNLQQNIETEIKKIKEQKGNITLTIGEFKNTTKKAKEENLSEKVRNKILQFLQEKEEIKIQEVAKYKLSGSVSKFVETFGVEIILTETATAKILGKFSCGIEKDNYEPLFTRLQYLFEGENPGCCKWKTE